MVLLEEKPVPDLDGPLALGGTGTCVLNSWGSHCPEERASLPCWRGWPVGPHTHTCLAGPNPGETQMALPLRGPFVSESPGWC